jgi:hypothetical protein
MAIRQYVDAFAPNHRIRVTTETAKGKLSHWAAQLEWRDPDEGWVWVARFDTAGGKPHRDRNRIAHHEFVSLPERPGKALRTAADNLKAEVEAYTGAYQVAKATGRES